MDLGALRAFVGSVAALIDTAADESTILNTGAPLLAELVRRDDWLPQEFAIPAAARYQRYLLHCDSRERFSVVGCVWGPGQRTPIHDHTVWGLVGILRGGEREERFVITEGKLASAGPAVVLTPGMVGTVSPRIGDVHRVSNAYDDRTSISIHVYGANIGATKHTVYEADGTPRWVPGSGYDNRTMPNLWGCAA